MSSYSLLMHDLKILLGLLVYGTTSIALPVLMQKKGRISKLAARKIIHLLAGLGVLMIPFFNYPVLLILLMLAFGTAVYFSRQNARIGLLRIFFNSICETEEKECGYLQGPLSYSISIILLISLFSVFAPRQLYFPIAGILTMIISDTFAAMIGRKWGKHRIFIPWTSSQRTIEGSAGFFIITFILGLLVFYSYGYLGIFQQTALSFKMVMFFSIITAFIGTFTELISPSKWDDLLVPLSTTGVIFTASALV